MKNMYIAALLAGSALAPAAAFAQQPAATLPATGVQAQGEVGSCDQLVVFVRDTDQDRAGITLQQAERLLQQRDEPACQDALRTAQAGQQGAPGQQGTGGASNVVVDQDAAAIRVEVPEPQVQVQQPRPNVTVRQPQPEILVRQPAPTVTIDIPQPEITVRMPQPEVNVQQAQPQVQVQQGQPEVSVSQPQMPQVQLQEGNGQAQVDIQGGNQARVTVERSSNQPQVTYESEQPQVRINQAQGEPQVRMEQAGGQLQPARQAQAPVQGQQTAQPALTENREGADLAVNRMASGEQQVSVQDLIDYDVVGANGEVLGDVEEIVNVNNRLYGVIGAGGFLGIGEKQVAIPMSSLVLRGDQLIAPNLTETQVDSIQEFDVTAYPVLPREQRVTVGRQ